MVDLAEIASLDEVPTGYRMTELGFLPEAWRVFPLDKITLKIRQVNLSLQPKRTVQYIDVSAVSSEQLRITAPTAYVGAEAPGRARQEVRANDTIFATIRPSLHRVAQVPTRLDGEVCSTAFCVLRPNPAYVDHNFLFFTVSSDPFVASIAKHEKGSSYPAVSDKDVQRELIALPPLPEQRAIAHVLSTVQRAREATEAIIAATRQLQRSLMRHLFIHGPVPPDAPADIEVRNTLLGNLPAHWHVARLADIASLLSGGTPSKQRPEWWSGPIPWASPKDLKVSRLYGTKDHISEDALAHGSRLVGPGTLLIVVRGMILAKDIPIALVAVPMAFNQDLKAIVPGAKIDADYLFYAVDFAKGQLVREIGTSAHGTHRLGTSALEGVLVPLPPLPEQKAIRDALTAVEDHILAYQGRRNALQQLFNSLLHDLMTVRVRVRKPVIE